MQRIIYNIALISVLLTLFSCTDTKVESKQMETVDDRIFVSKSQFEHSKMTLGNIEEKSFPITIKTSGMIDVPPENRAVVNATMGGYIKTTPLLIGDKVRKGQKLVTIENPEFVRIQQEYLEVNEQLAYLKSEFDRQKVMIAEKITSQKSFLYAESTYKTAMARHSGLKKQLSMLNISSSAVESGKFTSVVTIYAPITGSITKVNVSKGTYVSPATPILEIVDNDHIHVELSVFEKDIMKLKKGQEIDFRIPESSTDTYKAKVHLIGTAIEQNRTIKVHGHLEKESEVNFLIGMFVEAEIISESTSTIALPETAIAALENTYLVLKLDEENNDGYYFTKLEIEIGKTYNGYTQLKVSDNLTPNTKFLTKGTFNLLADE